LLGTVSAPMSIVFKYHQLELRRLRKIVNFVTPSIKRDFIAVITKVLSLELCVKKYQLAIIY